MWEALAGMATWRGMRKERADRGRGEAAHVSGTLSTRERGMTAFPAGALVPASRSPMGPCPYGYIPLLSTVTGWKCRRLEMFPVGHCAVPQPLLLASGGIFRILCRALPSLPRNLSPNIRQHPTLSLRVADIAGQRKVLPAARQSIISWASTGTLHHYLLLDRVFPSSFLLVACRLRLGNGISNQGKGMDGHGGPPVLLVLRKRTSTMAGTLFRTRVGCTM